MMKNAVKNDTPRITSGELTPRAKQVIAHTPLGRYGDPKDLIGAVMLGACSPKGVTPLPEPPRATAVVCALNAVRRRS